MFCIAAFIVFLILGIFSAKYRKLAKKAWSCVLKKTTLRACDTGFKEEAKNVILGKLIFTKPRLAKFLDKWLEVFATIFVVLSIWSLLIVAQSGLNLLVYDTCYPKSVESCSLGGEACGISSGGDTFFDAVKNLTLLTWIKDETLFLGDTISRIPDRFKDWKVEEYIDKEKATYYLAFDEKKPTALEIIDPGCVFCSKLFKNTKEANFEYKYNITYIPYAIPEKVGYKFPNSSLVISYLEATKFFPLEVEVSPDWQILEKMFTGKTPEGQSYQENFNILYSAEEAESILLEWLLDIGYDNETVQKIREKSRSEEIEERIKAQIDTVENKVRTIKIPTIIFDDRRYDRVIDVDKLKK